MTCPKCLDTGWLRQDIQNVTDPNFGKAIPCECKIRETQEAAKHHAMKLWQGSDIPDDQRGWTLDNHPGDKLAIEQARIAIESKCGVWLFWSCKYGPGKSGILVAAANALALRGEWVIYRTAWSMLEELKRGFKTGEYDELLESLRTIPVLLIDEFHRFYSKQPLKRDEGEAQGWSDALITDLMDYRYSHWQTMLTMLATNKHPKLEADHPIAARLQDNLRCHIIEVRGENLRTHARETEKQ